jgi:hypothetical protein
VVGYCAPFTRSLCPRSLDERTTSSAAEAFSLSEQEEEEIFDHHLVTSLETDVVPCIGDECVPDYLITQLAKILQQGSQLLQDGSGEEYPPTPTSPTHRPTPLSSKAEGEEVGSTVPLLAVSRERFSYWCLDLLFFICPDTAKGRSTILGVYLRKTNSHLIRQ